MKPTARFYRYIFFAAIGLYAVYAAYRVVDRCVEHYQSFLVAVLGGMLDVTGVSAIYTGFTSRDLASGGHMGLSHSEQWPVLLLGFVQFALFLGVFIGLGIKIRMGSKTTPKPIAPDKSHGTINDEENQDRVADQPQPSQTKPLKATAGTEPTANVNTALLVTCANCQKRLRIQAKAKGKRIKCPGCGHAFLADQASS